MPAFTPRNKRVVCPHCGDVFARGRGFNKHVRFCRGRDGASEALPAPRGMEGLEEDDVDMEWADDYVPEADVGEQDHSIAEHFDRLEALGTLDLSHVLHYSQWGKVPVKDDEVEICRFLRSTQLNGGASDGSAQSSLDYARSLEGRADLLPKSIKTCWAKVDRVSSTVLRNVHYTIHYDVHCCHSL